MDKQKVKEHVKKNKVAYSVAITTVVVAGFTYLITRDPKSVLQRGADAVLQRGAVSPDQAKTGTFIFASGGSSVTTGDITTNVHAGTRGHPGFLTRWIETGEVFKSQGAAARAAGETEALLSGHLNGKFDSVNGKHFERICMAA